jgi:hypothetical protein
MADEITVSQIDRPRLRVALVLMAGIIIVIAVLVTAIAVAAMDTDSVTPDTSVQSSASATETSVTQPPQQTPPERRSFFEADPLEGVDCVREPLVMRTDGTSVGKLLSKDQIALITCAQ